MRLNLMQGIPVDQPLPADLPPVGGETMHLDGVVYLDQCNAIFVGFTDATALNAAIAATGWHRADPVLAPLVLDAGRPDYGPIGRLVFIVKGIAYHSWTLDAA